MAIIPPAPADINKCAILRILREKSDPADGLAAKAQQFIAAATPMIDLVAAGPFRTYTLHNRDHAKKLLHLTEHILHPETLEILTPLECVFLIYAAFLHDMGLAVTSTERDRILRSPEYQDTLRRWPEIETAISQVRSAHRVAADQERPALEALMYQLHEAALTAYLRPQHATVARYKSLIAHLVSAGGPDLFTFRGVSFEDWIIDICVSHNLDAACLAELRSPQEDRFPRDLSVSHETVNAQFCAAVLRLIDILDFDRERTPNILFESLGLADSDLPGAEVSIREWEKHMSIHSLDVRAGELVVSAECKHPAIERTIRDFCEIIEREIKDTLAILNRNSRQVAERYRLVLPTSIRTRIASRGYIYRVLSLRLNQSAIISLLMGEKLYASPSVAVRELIQNSLDACAVRRHLDSSSDYVPQIAIKSETDSAGRTWLEIDDNGIGMDDHVIAEYFLSIGSSYYESNEFKRQMERQADGASLFRPISKFGIGILSVFMLADVLEVQTRRALSPRGDHESRLIRIERLGGLAFIAQGARTAPGTTVRIRLRADSARVPAVLSDIASYLTWLIIRPWCLISVSFERGRTFHLPALHGGFYSTEPEALATLRDKGREVLVIDARRWSQRLRGLILLLFEVTPDSRLVPSNVSWVNQENVRWSDNRHMLGRDLLVGYNGNRVSVNGFRLKSVRLKNIMGLPRNFRPSFLIDIDAVSDENIEFDVSRERLTKRGELALRDEIRSVVLSAMSETGVFVRLTSEPALGLLQLLSNQGGARSSTGGFTVDAPTGLSTLIESVRRALPVDAWPKGVHHKIAEDLGISSSLASRLVGFLISRGLVINPNNHRSMSDVISPN
jgi:molecular chaperone HtpG